MFISPVRLANADCADGSANAFPPPLTDDYLVIVKFSCQIFSNHAPHKLKQLRHMIGRGSLPLAHNAQHSTSTSDYYLQVHFCDFGIIIILQVFCYFH